MRRAVRPGSVWRRADTGSNAVRGRVQACCSPAVGVPFAAGARTPPTPRPRAAAADRLGYPVVVKLNGDAIAHKTERGLRAPHRRATRRPCGPPRPSCSPPRRRTTVR